MTKLRTHVADRQAKYVPPIQLRVREIRLAARVHALQDRRVDRLALRLARARGRIAKAHEREGNRSDALPLRSGIHPTRELPRHLHLLTEPSGEAVSTERTDDHPQLQRA